MNNTMKRIAALSVFALLAVSPAQANSFADAQLLNYSQANEEIAARRHEMFASLDDEAAQHSLVELKASMQDQIDQIIESSPLSRSDYDAIQLALRDDEALRERYDELVAQ